MERLRENRFLMYTIAASSAVVIALTFGLSQDLSNTFEIVEFPDEVSLFSSNILSAIQLNIDIFLVRSFLSVTFSSRRYSPVY